VVSFPLSARLANQELTLLRIGLNGDDYCTPWVAWKLTFVAGGKGLVDRAARAPLKKRRRRTTAQISSRISGKRSDGIVIPGTHGCQA
jgi:hypothetical protein